MAGEPFLKKNSKGEAVRRLQQALVSLGFNPGTPDGSFGTKTMDAVIAFQTSKGLIADGKVGDQTWAALAAAQPGGEAPPPPAPGGSAKVVALSLEPGNRYFASIDGSKFFVGSRVSFGTNKGLMNAAGTPAQRYDRGEFRAQYGFWADFIHPTAMAEGALFHTLNTYDIAHFTFSFLQYAAHVPNGDFVAYFRQLLNLPQAKDYFPDLRLDNGRITRVTAAGPAQLESDQSTAGLVDYLNPSAREVEDTEVIQAAKFVHWVQNDPEHRRVQVDVGVAHFKSKMVEYANRYGLDGTRDTTCLVVADIRHQGRARSADIVAALQSGNPLESLLKIGESKYAGRIGVLRREIQALTAEGTFGHRRYSLANRDFVDG
jgi:peptidoglycan hydrolase-like protein with peptidoglycan-binding domain